METAAITASETTGLGGKSLLRDLCESCCLRVWQGRGAIDPAKAEDIHAGDRNERFVR